MTSAFHVKMMSMPARSDRAEPAAAAEQAQQESGRDRRQHERQRDKRLDRRLEPRLAARQPATPAPPRWQHDQRRRKRDDHRELKDREELGRNHRAAAMSGARKPLAENASRDAALCGRR